LEPAEAELRNRQKLPEQQEADLAEYLAKVNKEEQKLRPNLGNRPSGNDKDEKLGVGLLGQDDKKNANQKA
jgi:hypothetical protein